MRKLREIDAELKALAEKAKALKAQRLIQLGELVLLTGADALELDMLAGALLAAEGERSAGQGGVAQRRRRLSSIASSQSADRRPLRLKARAAANQ